MSEPTFDVKGKPIVPGFRCVKHKAPMVVWAGGRTGDYQYRCADSGLRCGCSDPKGHNAKGFPCDFEVDPEPLELVDPEMGPGEGDPERLYVELRRELSLVEGYLLAVSLGKPSMGLTAVNRALNLLDRLWKGGEEG